MEENVALDSSKQKQFVKSIKGIQKRIKKNDGNKNSQTKLHDGKIRLGQKRKSRGLVYLGHIPHGFYEHEMTQYFKQFGVVTNSRVIRSKRTGRSKGYAFVEFKDPAVAEIVAETMNNYLMGKRLIKAACIPPEKQRRFAQRKHWNVVHNPSNENRMKMKKAHNANMDEEGELKKARKMLSTFLKTKKKLSALGINYDLFTPVDVPENLLKLLDDSDEKLEVKDDVNENKKNVLLMKNKIAQVHKNVTIKQENEKTRKKSEISKEIGKSEDITSNKKQKKKNETTVSKEQILKEQKLKRAGVKSIENFIKINKEDATSDSEYEFDSDEFDRMLENEADNDCESEECADEESEDEENDDNISDQESCEDDKVLVSKNKRNKKTVKNKEVISDQNNSQNVKRKATGDSLTVPKKSKFENRNNQKLKKKQFKNRK